MTVESPDKIKGILKWDRKEIARLESVLVKRRSLLDGVDAEVDRLVERRKRAVSQAEGNLAAAVDRAKGRVKGDAE